MSANPCGCDDTFKNPDGRIGHVCEWHKERAGVLTELSSSPHVQSLSRPIQEGSVSFGLPSTDAARKAIPIWSGVVMYFPDVLAAVAEVSRLGNDQHNPGQPLHWAREKSTDQMNTAFRHMLDHARGNIKDTDGTWHLAKAIWRLSAELQLTIEQETKCVST